jgi:hypothetical protein
MVSVQLYICVYPTADTNLVTVHVVKMTASEEMKLL